MIDLTKSAGFDLARRHRAERRFRLLGAGAIAVALLFLGWMLVTVARDGAGAARLVQIRLTVDLTASSVDPADPGSARYGKIVKSALRAIAPEVKKRKDKKKLYRLISAEAPFELARMVASDPALLGAKRALWFTASDEASLYVRGKTDVSGPEKTRRISDREVAWVDALTARGDIRSTANWRFLSGGDSREPEVAGILAALVGSALSLAVCFAISFPLGIAAAIHLEEFAPRNRLSDVIEVNINNLAAVPSIVFGLLGLAVFLNVLGLPRSSPLVGGMVLSLMTLPTIIIAARASLLSVPPSIKEAALALGATPVQAVFHHVFPVALPGMLTGAIIGMARALGDTAPLLMIGMVAFVVDVPKSILAPATALPVQVFLWADSPERAFTEKTSAAILVLLVFLVVMNLAAVIMRRRMEKRF